VADTLVLDELLRQGEGWQPERNRLMAALCVATAVHLLLIISITFDHVYKGLSAHRPMLEILLIQPPATTVDNPNADYLSEFNQRGSGTDADARTSQAMPVTTDTDSQPTPTRDAWGPRSASDSEELISGKGHRRVAASTTAGTPATYAPLPTFAHTAGIVSNPLAPSDSYALRGIKNSEDSSIPNTRASPAAMYLNAWRQKIEQVGTTHYPLMAVQRAGLTGNPVLEVQILSNGQLGEVRLQRSSGHAALDQAALGILRMAAPFEPFPKELAAQNPTLRLAYEWQFLSGNLR
jgi:periplasmic protein TonB